MNRIKTTFIIIAFIAATGMVTMAFAHGGWDGDDYSGHMGYRGYMMGPGMMGYGYDMGPGMMAYGPYGRGHYAANLSREDSIKLQQARDKFLDETRTLRNEIRDKQLTLNDALDNTNPDKATVMDLQKELSQLQSNYDQKAMAYRLEVRKLLPQSADRDDYGYGPGYGGCRW